MKTSTVLAVLMICVTSCKAIRWKDCGSKGSKVTGVMVTGCKDDSVCNLPRGTNVTFTVNFTTTAAAETAKSVVHGLIDRIPLPFPVKNPDACKDKAAGISCPLKGDTKFSYRPVIYLMTSYPKLKVVVRWELQNSDGEDIFCVLVPTKIVDAPKKKVDSNRTKIRSNKTIPRLFQLL